MCRFVCTYTDAMAFQVEVRGPLVGISSLLPLYGSLELNSDCQCWSPVPVHQNPLCWPTNTFDNCMLSLSQVQLIWGTVFRRHNSLLTCKSCQGFFLVKHASTFNGNVFLHYMPSFLFYCLVSPNVFLID